MSPATPATRDRYIDFLRGLIIVDMILVHYSPYFSPLAFKALNYNDIAMEGFLLTAGFMTGRHYFPAFVRDPRRATKRLLVRAVKQTIVQYILIFTISYAHYLILGPSPDDPSGLVFLRDSLLFRNQPGLMHILPTFIALSLLSPLILWLVVRSPVALVAASGLCFALSQIDPELFRYGAPAVFPLASWQIFFVLGCCLGRWAGTTPIQRLVTRPVSAVVGLCLMLALLLKYGAHILPPATAAAVAVVKFPLNVAGLFYGVTLVAALVVLTSQSWRFLEDLRAADVMGLMGRNSLLVFAIHVYFAQYIEIAAVRLAWTLPAIYLLMVLNFAFTWWLLRIYEDVSSATAQRIAGPLRFLFN